MTCERFPIPGGVAIVCSRGRRGKRCACGKPAPFLCDGPRDGRPGKTCDAPLCATCRVQAGEGRDLCRTHAGTVSAGEQLALFAGAGSR